MGDFLDLSNGRSVRNGVKHRTIQKFLRSTDKRQRNAENSRQERANQGRTEAGEGEVGQS